MLNAPFMLDANGEMSHAVTMRLESAVNNGFTKLVAERASTDTLHILTLSADAEWINDTDRLIYRIINDQIEIAACRSHYDD